jgi:hypothetical protein
LAFLARALSARALRTRLFLSDTTTMTAAAHTPRTHSPPPAQSDCPECLAKPRTRAHTHTRLPRARSPRAASWFRKRPNFAGHWKNRFVVLDTDRGVLSEYGTEPDAKSEADGAVPVFFLELHGGLKIESLGDKMVRLSAINPTKDKLWVLRISEGDHTLITLGSASSETVAKWQALLEGICRASKKTLAATGKTSSSGAYVTAQSGHALKPRPKSVLPVLWGEDHQWKMVEQQEGLLIEGEKEFTKQFPSLRCRATVASPPDKVFALIMDDARRSLWDQGVLSSSVLREISESSHIVYVQMRPIWVGPLWTESRDLVMLRYTRHDQDQQYVITWQSVEEPELCPPKPGFVRGRVFAMGFSITPAERGAKSTVRFSCHADPGGSMSQMPHVVLQRWMFPFVSRVIGIQKALSAEGGSTGLKVEHQDDAVDDEEEAVPSPFPTPVPAAAPPALVSTSIADQEVNTLKLGTFPHDQWCETPQIEPFTIRGKTYLDDAIKIKSAAHKFHLVAAELNKVEVPMRHCAARSDSPLRAIQKAYPEREVFVLQFMLPGPPCYSLPVYAVAKPGVLDDDSPFARLYHSFLDGSDEYRNTVFKMIPRVTKGAFVVKKTVGETPAIMGKKINLHYFRGPGYIEVDVDLGTSAVAGSILSVFKGYATTVTADMCLLLEGHSEAELPEEVMCSFRMIKPVLANAKLLAADPDPAETLRLIDLAESGKKGELSRQGSDAFA